MDQLLQYIIQQEQAGYKEEQIREALSSEGYDKKTIDKAFKELSSGKHDDHVHEYVQQYARQGYSAPQVFQELTSQGHEAKQVRKAIHDVFGKATSSTTSHLSTVVYVIIALFIGMGGTYFITAPGSSVEPVAPGPNIVSLAPSEIIAGILEIVQSDGKDAGVQACQSKLRGTDRDRCLAAVAAASADDSLCDQIVDVAVHDSCLMNFLNDNFESVCQRVSLAENSETCNSIRALRGSASAT